MKMLNNYVLVKIKKEDLKQTPSGILIPTKTKSYKVVEVIEPDKDNELKKGIIAYIPKNAGLEIGNFQIINKREIILTL